MEWDSDTGKYRVKIHGQWVVVPDSAVITEPNRLGYAMVWYYDLWTIDEAGKPEPQIRCFLPGAGI